MKKYLLPVLLIFGSLFMHSSSRASHIFGADFFYQYDTGNIYKLTLVIYGDCSGSSFPMLPGTPQVIVYDYGNQIQQFTLPSTGPGVEVTPVCPSQINNTTCKGGTVPGVTKFTYSTKVTLPHASAGWRFRFTGNMGASSSAGRSNSITNLVIGGTSGSLMVMEAELNNLNGHNSSPQFTTIPTPFYCVNVLQQYNQGAVDSDNDLLVYSLAPALETGGPATYVNGYSPTYPLSTTGNFSFNTTTGQLSFIPDQIQKSTVVNKVVEYRNGVIVGTAMREMTFIVLGGCNNMPPTGNADTSANSFQGAIPDGLNFFNVCQGTPNTHFQILPLDPDGDTIQVSVNGLPTGATAAITGNNTTAPVIHFNWNTTGIAPGNYTFYVTYQDQGCPLSSQQTQAYTVRIIRPNEMTTLVLSPTHCFHQAALQYHFSYGILPRTVVITQGATVIHSFTDSTGLVTDSLPSGNYTVAITSPKLSCPSFYTIHVVDSGSYPISPFSNPVFYCKDDVPMPLPATPTPGASLTWYDLAGNVLPAAPVPNTSVAGIFDWLVSQRYNVCESRKDTVRVYVTKRPVASITAPPVICSKDTAHISFNGSVGVGPIIDYQWSWNGSDYLVGQNGGPWDVQWNSAGIKTVVLQVFENMCPSDTVSVQILVKPTPRALFGPFKSICLYDTVQLQYNGVPLPDQAYNWSFGGAPPFQSTEGGPFQLHWSGPGIKHLFLEVSKDGCSDSASGYLTVNPAPDIHILNPAGKLCLGDKVYLQATGSDNYTWTPRDLIFYEPDGTLYTRVKTPTTYTVTSHNAFGCVDSDAITYDDIEPCCKFSYPNAFTPDGDGLNDKFRIIMYGNEEQFALSIYDRWGQRVFYTFDPKAYWDGTANGKPCEIGTYFYYLRARCLTGHDEEHKGDVLLIR